MSKFKASNSNVKWDRSNRSVTDDANFEDPNGPVMSDQDTALAMAADHPKSTPPSIQPLANVLPGSPGSGSAPGANGPPTTGAIGPGGPLGMD
jgi:hypothetical protein